MKSYKRHAFEENKSGGDMCWCVEFRENFTLIKLDNGALFSDWRVNFRSFFTKIITVNIATSSFQHSSLKSLKKKLICNSCQSVTSFVCTLLNVDRKRPAKNTSEDFVYATLVYTMLCWFSFRPQGAQIKNKAKEKYVMAKCITMYIWWNGLAYFSLSNSYYA